MSKLLFFIALFFAGLAFSQEAVDTTKIRQIYDQYRAGYAALEAAHGHYINTPNVRMHYMTWGNKKDLPLVWVHGTYSNAYELYEIADSLVAKGFYVIAPEYYGHGLTPVPQKEVSLYHVADDVQALLKELGIKKAVIGGWSRGGSVCTAFYDAYPAMVLGIVLEDGGSVAWNYHHHRSAMDSVKKNFDRTFANWKVSSQSSEFLLFAELYPRLKNYPAPAVDRWCYTNLSRWKKDAGGGYSANPQVRQLACQENAEQMMAMIYRPMAASNLFGASASLQYPKIIYRNLSVPLLILDPVSEEDEFDATAENRALQQAHPQWIVHKIYANTGHAVKLEHPAEFLNDLLEFKKKIQARGK